MATVRRRRHAVEQESYFVSMTDLMIGLLFVFIIMLMSFAINYRRAETDNVAAREVARAEAAELRRTNDRLTDNQNTLGYVLSSIERMLKQQGVPVLIFPEKGILRLPEDILFDSGRAALNQRGRASVAALARALDLVLPCFAAGVPAESGRCPGHHHGRLEAVYVEGHTDDRPVAAGRSDGVRDNWDLSAARAKTTYNALLSTAPEVRRLTNDRGEVLVGVSGYGEFRPVASNTTEEGRRANRRIDLRFLMATPERAPGPPR